MRLNTFALLLLAAPALAQQPTVSSIQFDGVSHSAFRVKFTASADFYWVRVRYAVSPATCASGTGGSVQGTQYNNYAHAPLHAGSGNVVTVSGLIANTTYQICPEISTDFSNWSTGAGATITTPPLPAVHPAPPIDPALFNTDYPDTTNYDVVTVANDCGDLMGRLSAAMGNQVNKGTVINIPAGAVCNGPYNLTQRAQDVASFDASAVNTSNNTINYSNHGFSEGNTIVFGTSYGCLPGSLTNLNGDCHRNGPIKPGQVYYVHVVSANTFQVYSGGAMNAGGTLCLFPDGGNGTELFVHWPRPLNWIIIRTATSEAQFAPQHTRVSPAWLPKMATLLAPASVMTGAAVSNRLMSVSDFDGNNSTMIANLRFVGLEFTYANNPHAYTSMDPLPWYTLFATAQTNENIILDRCYLHGNGTPNRVLNAVWWDGMNVAIVDSYFEKLEYFHSIFSGLGLTKVN